MEKEKKERSRKDSRSPVSSFWVFFGAVLCGSFVRHCVSLYPYSGAGSPPMFGDYEAQRHWMEVTTNLPVEEWYMNTTNNNLLYWGLDYPPLTAYHSWVCGKIAHQINPDWVKLHSSRGIESYEHKLFMRATAFVADLVIYFPAVLLYCFTSFRRSSRLSQALAATVILLQPGLVLIDHGHFQYNAVSLGLALWGVLAVINDYYVFGAVAFSLALNYKQMELYHALPFFCYLLGKSLRSKRWYLQVVKLGIAVIGTFALSWLPFLYDVTLIQQVLHRIFPVARGVFEDKVANVWCSLSIVIKFKGVLPSKMAMASLATTATMMLPSSFNLLRQPTKHNFLLALVNSSLVFFLFSFQVHEKSILLAALPVALLQPHYPALSTWFQLVASFSMYPLLVRDGLLLAYVATIMLFLLSSVLLYRHEFSSENKLIQRSMCVSLVGMVALHLLAASVKPPPSLPDLFPVLFSLYSCGHFLLFTAIFHAFQLNLIRPNMTASLPDIKVKSS